METSNLMLWIRLGFGLVIGLIFTCVLYKIYKIKKDIANTNDDVVIPIYQSRSAAIRSQNRLAIHEDRSRTIPQDGASTRYI